MKKCDVVVIGGGAAGLMAAICAARMHCKVAVLEHNSRVGKKLLSTGNGRCNLTNLKQDTGFYRGQDPAFVMPIFKQFGLEETLAFFHGIGVLTTDKNGYVYPKCAQASAVLNALHQECIRLGVLLVTECGISDVKKTKNGFEIHTDKELFFGKSLVMAPGGLAASKLGSDGSAYPYIEKFGHKIQNVVPGLVALKAKEAYFKSLAGIRAEISLKLYIDFKEVTAEKGELQMTAYGISGIPVFQISRYAAYGLKEGRKVQVCIDFAPEYTKEELLEELKVRRKHFRDMNMEAYLNGVLNKKQNEVLLKLAGLKSSTPVKELKDSHLEAIARQTKQWTVNIVDTLPFEQAQVMAGGICTEELYENLESKRTDGLFFAGEVVDIDGICGGYNLQWAWSSGYMAGTAAAERSLHASHS